MVVTVVVQVLSEPQSAAGRGWMEDHFLFCEESERRDFQAKPLRIGV